MQFSRLMTGTAIALSLAAAPVAGLAQAADTTTADTATENTAQDQTAQAAPESDAETQEFTDTKLDAFAQAVLDVTEVRNEYAPTVQAAADEAEQKALVQEANDAMVTAVKDAEGITLEEYLAINKAASSDETLNERIVERIQTLTQKPG